MLTYLNFFKNLYWLISVLNLGGWLLMCASVWYKSLTVYILYNTLFQTGWLLVIVTICVVLYTCLFTIVQDSR